MTNLVLLRPKIEIINAMPNPPLGLGYLAAILKKNGHIVHIIDCANLKQSYKQICLQIKKLNPEAIGITALSSYYFEMRKLSHLLQNLETPLILGGIHVSALPEFSLRDCEAGFAVIGEGELTILELMDKWQDIKARKQINGIAYLENGQFKVNPMRELISNLDNLPFPAWDQINPLKYPLHPHGYMMKRYPVAPILTTRGCPFSCSYCASTQFWRHTFRKRSAQNIADEVEYLVNTFRIREIHIWDDNFTLLKKHVVSFCREILQRKLDLTFMCPNGVRIDSLDKELLTLMKYTGFYSLTFAIESGSQDILNRANKKTKLNKIIGITKIAKKLGYIIPSFFILGLPGETYATVRRTIQFAKRLPLDVAGFFIAKPLPGSRLFDDWVRENNLSKIDPNLFNFFISENQLGFSDGKRKLNLPKDAYREFNFRPIQILRFLRLLINYYPKKEILSLLRRIFHYVS